MHAGENPFSVQRIHRLPYLFADDVTLAGMSDLFWQRCERGWRRQVLVGPHGSGKSTLLRELGDYWGSQGILVQRLAAPDFPRPEARDAAWRAAADLRSEVDQRGLARRRVLLVDGGERLSWIRWQQLQWRYRRFGILMTTHRRGRLPVLSECQTSAERFVALCRALLKDQPMRVQAAFALPVLCEVYDRQRGNVRNCFFELYDRALGL
jgi:hypothetical protein